jgi:hypothetical protein
VSTLPQLCINRLVLQCDACRATPAAAGEGVAGDCTGDVARRCLGFCYAPCASVVKGQLPMQCSAVRCSTAPAASISAVPRYRAGHNTSGELTWLPAKAGALLTVLQCGWTIEVIYSAAQRRLCSLIACSERGPGVVSCAVLLSPFVATAACLDC